LVENVVLVILDRVRGEKMGQFVAARVLICPLLHSLEHIALNLHMIIARRRVMEGTEDVINNLIDRDTSVFPCKENTRNCVLENSGSDTSST
jgi:hypothetical protein